MKSFVVFFLFVVFANVALACRPHITEIKVYLEKKSIEALLKHINKDIDIKSSEMVDFTFNYSNNNSSLDCRDQYTANYRFILENGSVFDVTDVSYVNDLVTVTQINTDGLE